MLILFTLFFVPSYSVESPTNLIASCLNQYNINNFTLYPNHEEDPTVYLKLLNFSIQNLRFAEPSIPKPLAIIMPESREELVNSVRCCREGSWEIRLRSGGHSYEGTSSISEDGSPFVIIEMMKLDKVRVDVKSRVAWVEGGATLGQVYCSIAEKSSIHGHENEGPYGFSAGSCPTVGVGGHISGGGFGLLSRKYGLAADNVVDALLIIADGRLLDREAMGEEVFWAIRGGGGGVFGVIYAWKIQLVKVPKTVTSFIVSRPGTKDYIAKLIHKWQSVAPKLNDEFYLSAFVGASLPEIKTIAMSATFKGFYQGPKIEALSILGEVFPEISIADQECHEMSWIESILFFSGLENGSSVSDLKDRYFTGKHFFKAKSDYVKAIIPYNAIRYAIDMLEQEPKGYVILDPYGGAMERISSDSIAFPHRIGNLFTIQYLVEWNENDNNKSNAYMEWIRRFYNSMTPYVAKSPRAAYVNYMDLDLGVMDILESAPPSTDAVDKARDWGEKYFLQNYDRLVGAKTLIDPLNIFRNEQGIPPMSMRNVRAKLNE
ncbi:hypothetical protein LIER_15383 [Lithospermum erythrorhizon]|uniref:FAD-binding PCMH-type domain-containing protein n=1 Tax=Lithospermum erythrorhizon TaxID=34254 RepID=A0AAV3Q448_LITER